ncbi:methionyl-tRNA formyltransferase [Desulfosporosinus acidiphilus SJ4]|uniref:Methionyl-tRNA formyltransferase n=1 Tax=Desulfosporosinus acidiphilus (strain DSM 22704 / JCM 16185 / SJ4) TaxID=646529 RepID=I4D9U4_DESAJ|nr:methionyl-tRNA formyltransferase [Desulfosporosinus acidiphilus]AFM42568.1 methionyl-tRNA formyltransferase [Desulfosporosinus acidiphilus SJ4]
MRIVFMGTPDFAVPSLRALAGHGHEIVGVFTQPDRPAGRGKKLKPSPVKSAAEELNLPIFQPAKIKTPEGIQCLRELAPECIIVVAYGQLLSKEILDLPSRGCINVHASLLPSYRGAAPIHWAIINGEEYTGVTTMLMDEGLDTGDMLLKREIKISQKDTMGEIHDKLALLGGELLIQTLRELEQGTLTATAQSGKSNYAPLLNRDHERIDWTRSAVELHNQIRGLNPWPGAFALFREEQFKVWRSTVFSGQRAAEKENSFQGSNAEVGQILEVLEEGLLVQTGDGLLWIAEVQPAGKRPMSARDFLNGRHGQAGEKFT